MTLRFRPRPLVASICLAGATILSSAAHADMNETIGGMFDGMVSTSPTGSWETQSRGVVSGGGVRARTPITQEQLFNVQLPSADASCGGIDLFGGAFSFVNSDQLTQIGRHIISNAKNYAFKLGLEVVSPKIAGLMQEIENTVRAMNEMSVNSCEWAQGLVAPGARAIEQRMGVDMGLTGQEGQVFDDFFDSFAGLSDGANTEAAVSNNTNTQDSYEEMVGNIFWTAMQEAGVGSWSWIGSSTGNEIMEMVQSVTGTVVVGKKSNPDEERQVSVVQGQTDLYSFIFGSNSEAVISCNNYSACDAPSITTKDVDGLAERIEEMLIGTSGSMGLVHYYGRGHNPSTTLPTEYRNFMTSLPFEFGARIARLASVNEGSAEHLSRTYIPLLSLEMAHNLVRAQLRAARTAANQMDSPYQDDLLDLITEASRQLANQVAEIQVDQNVADMEATYRALLGESDVPRHHLRGTTSPDTVGTN